MNLRSCLNKFLLPFRVKLEKFPKDAFDLLLYSESARPQQPKYVNIGALDFPHPLWHNLDNPTDWDGFSKRQQGNIHLPHDLMSGKPLPISSDSVSIVYCSHVIEHLRDEYVRFLFSEVMRVLKIGGIFRLVAPDMSLFYDAYLRGDETLFQSGLPLYDCRSLEQKLLLQFASSLVCSSPADKQPKYSDEEIRTLLSVKSREDFFEFFSKQVSLERQKQNPAEHINWFTPQKTKAMLDASGFSQVYPSARGQSHLPVLRNTHWFDPYGDHSLYFECVK